MSDPYLPSEECLLLMRYRAEYPAMWERLQQFMYLDTELRPRQALRLLKSLLRIEWLDYGLTEEEINDLFAFKRKMLVFDKKHRPDNLDAFGTKLLIWVYDMPLTVLGQSRADENIPSEDQSSLQKIIAKTIFASEHFKSHLSAVDQILSQTTCESRWVKDIENLLLLEHFQKNQTERFDDQWESFRPSWKSMEGMMASYALKYGQKKIA